MDIRQIFPSRLKEARTRTGLSQSELAKRCGISQGTMSGFENGSSVPNLEVAADLAETLGVSIDWLCGFEASDVTPLQWLRFTDKLLTTQAASRTKSIKLCMKPENNIDAAIAFSGIGMEQFFTAYSALYSTRKQIGDLYETVITALMQKYAYLFSPDTVEVCAPDPATPPQNLY
jgi:transcriptional regulator with XRE-family HTH domain